MHYLDQLALCSVMKAQVGDVRIWNTLSLNDFDGPNRIYYREMQENLIQEQTIAQLVIVTKDGSRTPRSSRKMLAAYGEVFGSSLEGMVSVVVGVDEQKLTASAIKKKKSLWKTVVFDEMKVTIRGKDIFLTNFNETHNSTICHLPPDFFRLR